MIADRGAAISRAFTKSTLQRECTCGALFDISFIGLDEHKKITCPSCEDSWCIARDVINVLDERVFDYFKSTGLLKEGARDRAISKFMRMYDRVPTDGDWQQVSAWTRNYAAAEHAQKSEGPQPEPSGYTVPLVGEQHYQAAIRCCRVGDSVELLYEPDNPYDTEAVVAVSRSGDTLGYIPRDNWLRDALAEGKGVIAKISDASAGRRGFTEVLLAVTLVHGSATIGSRAFRPAGTA